MNAVNNPPHQLPTLPYALDALAPYISLETLEYHYGKHHKGYVTKLNDLIKDTEFANESLETLICTATGAVFNNAAQIWNHTFYWHCLSPDQAAVPDGLATAIEKQFGSLESLAAKFKETALSKFGSGWTWLVAQQDGTLAIRNSDDADNPLLWQQAPLLVCDVWEHAYYIDYRNDRSKYLDGFWRLVNWQFVAKNLQEYQRRNG